MSQGTLYDKLWDSHVVGVLDSGLTQLYVGKHLVHEVTSPQAFEMLRERGLKVRRPDLTYAVLDHVIPTHDRSRPFEDPQAELMAKTLEDNVREFGITYFGPDNGQGVCHVVFPEKGIIQPGEVVVCGDSHTCTYGAFGALAFGVGTTEVSHVLATQTLAMERLKVRRINFNGQLQKGITAKDVAIYSIKTLGVDGGLGFAYEFGGKAVEEMDMEERMTLCNMASVEGGARSGYVNPDSITFNYLKTRQFAPKQDFDKAVKYWESIASDSDAKYNDVVDIDASKIEPMVTWGVNPEQAIGISERIPTLDKFTGKKRNEVIDALQYMGLEPGQKILGVPIDIVFIGSCTNGRMYPDLNDAAAVLYDKRVAVKTLIVPGSEAVKEQAEHANFDGIFQEAGAEWRYPGCSMCLAMNPDRLEGNQRSASTSNRNFKGRQGSPTGRTHLMSPLTAAASALEGKIADPRKYMR